MIRSNPWPEQIWSSENWSAKLRPIVPRAMTCTIWHLVCSQEYWCRVAKNCVLVTKVSIVLRVVPLRYRISIREFHEWHDTTLVSFSTRIPTSQRGILATAVSTAKTRSVCVPCWWRRKWRLPVISWHSLQRCWRWSCQSKWRTWCWPLLWLTSLRPELSPLKLWPEWHLRLMLLLYRSHGNCRRPGCRSPSTDPRKVAQYLTRERKQQSAKETQQQSQLENSWLLYYLTCVDESPAYNDHEHTGDSRWAQLTSITARQRGSNHVCSATTDDTLMNSVWFWWAVAHF